jgi:hypothetical protein
MQDIRHDTCPNKTIKCKVDKMNVTSKAVIPNKEWILEDHGKKIGSISKIKKGYAFLRKGQKFEFKSLKEIKDELNISVAEQTQKPEPIDYGNTIYGYPCSSKPYEPVYNLKKRLPLYAKSAKSKSQYCAGYYVIKFRKGWVKSFCPKLITLERYPFHGPFKTETEMRNTLNTVNKS